MKFHFIKKKKKKIRRHNLHPDTVAREREEREVGRRQRETKATMGEARNMLALLLCAAGIYGAYLTQGYLQEMM